VLNVPFIDGGVISMDHAEQLYMAPEDLYRLGNAESSLVSRVRERDVDIQEINGIKMVVANGQGISLYNKNGLEKMPLSGWVWEIKASTAFPAGLKLIRDDRPEGHYTLAPVHNMLFGEYVSLLERVAVHCRRVYRKRA
jgi:hypothetical protein